MSIHVCRCVHNGREEYHLRYPGITEREAQELAADINGNRRAFPDIDDATVEEMRVAYEGSQSRQDNIMASADGIRAAIAVLRRKLTQETTP